MTQMQKAVAQALANALGTSVEGLQAALALAAENSKAKQVQPHTTPSEHKAERSAKFAVVVAQTFEKLGLGGVPNVDIRTGGGWMAEGYVPKKGEKAHRFQRKGSGFHYAGQTAKRGLPLFHRSQVTGLQPKA